MTLWATSAPYGSSSTVVDNMAFFKIKNDIQTQYIGNCDISGANH